MSVSRRQCGEVDYRDFKQIRKLANFPTVNPTVNMITSVGASGRTPLRVLIEFWMISSLG